jgi:hypothetical protein
MQALQVWTAVLLLRTTAVLPIATPAVTQPMPAAATAQRGAATTTKRAGHMLCIAAMHPLPHTVSQVSKLCCAAARMCIKCLQPLASPLNRPPPGTYCFHTTVVRCCWDVHDMPRCSPPTSHCYHKQIVLLWYAAADMCLTPESSTSWPRSSARWGLLVSPRSISRAMRAAVSSSMPQLQVKEQNARTRAASNSSKQT